MFFFSEIDETADRTPRISWKRLNPLKMLVDITFSREEEKLEGEQLELQLPEAGKLDMRKPKLQLHDIQTFQEDDIDRQQFNPVRPGLCVLNNEVF